MKLNELGPGLVLSRKHFDTILIGEDIAVTVVRIGPNAVRLHISAPQSTNIVRKEIKGRDVPIQTSIEDVADLGRRQLDEMIDHGV